jgi:hypothetical protein
LGNKNKIYVSGNSVLTNFISILLAERKITHNFQYHQLYAEQLSPTSNQLINNYSKNLELPYILSMYKINIKYIENTKIFLFNNNIDQQAEISSKYKYPIYAIDNRIRIISFDHKIKEFIKNDIIQVTNQNEQESENEINILGGYENKNQFEYTANQTEFDSTRVRKFISINLKINTELLNYFNATVSFIIDGFGEIICYPFLHYTNEIGICMVINFNINTPFDIKTEFKNSIDILSYVSGIVKNKIHLLNRLIDNGTPFENNVFKGFIKPYFMCPANIKNDKLYLGVGSAVMNTDPIVGQGYNLGVKLCKFITDKIINDPLNKIVFRDSINKYSIDKLDKLRKITEIFTGSSKENRALTTFFSEMIKNENLASFWFEGIEDIEHYFPWIENEKELKYILENFDTKNKS